MLDALSARFHSLRPIGVLKALGGLLGALVALGILVFLGLESPLLMGLLHFALLIAAIVLLVAGSALVGLLLSRNPRGVLVGGIGGFLAAPLVLAFWFPNRAQLARICYECVGYSVTRITLDFEESPPSAESLEEELGALIKSTALPIRYYVSSRYGGHWEKDVRPGYMKLEGRRLEVVTGQPMDPSHLRLLQAVLQEAFGPTRSLPTPLRTTFEVDGQAGTADLDPHGTRLSVVERPRTASVMGAASGDTDPSSDRVEEFTRRRLGLSAPRSFDLVMEVPVIGGSGSLFLLGIPAAKRRMPLNFPKESGLGEVQALGVAANAGEPLMMQIYLSSHEATDPEALVRERGFALAPAPWRADLARAVFPKLTARRARFRIEPGIRFSPRYTQGFRPLPPS